MVESILLDPAEVIMKDLSGRVTPRNQYGQRYILCKLSEEKRQELNNVGIETFMLKPKVGPDGITEEEEAPAIRIRVSYPPDSLIASNPEFAKEITPEILVRCEGVNTSIDREDSYSIDQFEWDRVALAIRPRFTRNKFTGATSVRAELKWLVIDTHESEEQKAQKIYGLGIFNKSNESEDENQPPF